MVLYVVCIVMVETHTADGASSHATDAEYRRCDVDVLLAQIGRQNVLAISGGRIERRERGLTLPVRYGYSVEVDLAANDTYTVRRVFTRSGSRTVKGVETDIHATGVGDSAYRDSCYRDPFGGHRE